ncbi:hypothetical protein D1007_59111 [Hordeum vulgare]|nr:hypothetical protein D1007_59111 [Hordeum vulgare]
MSAGPRIGVGARTDGGEVSSPLKGKVHQENWKEYDLRQGLEQKREQDLRNKLHDQQSSSATYGGNRGERLEHGMSSRSVEHRMDVGTGVGGRLGTRSMEREERRRGTFIRKPRQIYREVQHGNGHLQSAGVGLKRRARQINQSSNNLSPLGHWVQEIKELLRSRLEAKVTWVRRSGNGAAHKLAKVAVGTTARCRGEAAWEDSIPCWRCVVVGLVAISRAPEVKVGIGRNPYRSGRHKNGIA